MKDIFVIGDLVQLSKGRGSLGFGIVLNINANVNNNTITDQMISVLWGHHEIALWYLNVELDKVSL